MKLGCLLMAAGGSRRFGKNKLLESFGGTPLYVRALEVIPRSCFATICVVTGYEEIAAKAKEMGYETVCNDRPDLGVSRTIRLGMGPLMDCDGILFLTADQPCLSPQTVENVARAFEQQPDWIWAAGHEGKKGNPCLFPKALYPELLQLREDQGGSRVIRAHGGLLHLVEAPALELADCDTAEALSQLEQQKTQTFQ